MISTRSIACVIALALAGVGFAQWRGGRGGRGWGRGTESNIPPNARTAREVPSHSTETPMWTNPPAFVSDTFVFTRLQYDQGDGRGSGWSTDLPDSDLNLSYRLQWMTSIRVDPDGRFLRATDPAMPGHPFLYIVEPGGLSLDAAETVALRNYLNNGGFLLLDDFWGDAQWDNAEDVLREVLPGRRFVELPLTHPLYHCVFEIQAKGQIPNYRLGMQSEFDPEHRTWELPDATVVHHRAILDDQGRIMVLATHNTDNGDGWEREGESDYFFHNFSEKIAYPLGVNIVYYAMTH
jgi:hypothetical protein